jgi:HPt (histidine-containing phosphotransfer) domain-containing protein
MKEDMEATQRVGMQEHLDKPIEVDKLYSTLIKYISKKTSSKDKEVKNSNTAQDINLPEFKTIDISLGLKHLGDNKKLYLKILKDFYTNYNTLNLDNTDDKEFERVIHTIKGLSANIGALSLNKIAVKLNDTHDKSLLREFYHELKMVTDELLQLNQTDTNDIDKPKISKEKFIDCMIQIKEYANKKRAKPIKKILEELEGYALEQRDAEVTKKIQEALDKRDYSVIMRIGYV